VIEIRKERPSDLDAIREVNRQAFAQEEEGRIVDALRANDGLLLSLVAIVDGAVVGHIMFSPVSVGPLAGAALAPMAVRPTCQRQGIGSHLVERSLEHLRQSACPFVVVIGHPEFYPRFGFVPAGPYGLTCEWDVRAEAFMVKILNPDVCGQLAGRVQFRNEFTA